jgi:hypothetical protein
MLDEPAIERLSDRVDLLDAGRARADRRAEDLGARGAGARAHRRASSRSPKRATSCVFLPELLRLRGEQSESTGPAAALADYREAVSLARASGARSLEARAAESLAALEGELPVSHEGARQ